MNILMISPFSDDWDINTVIGSPEVAILIKGFTEYGFKIHLIIPKNKKNTKIKNLFVHHISFIKLPRIKPLLPLLNIFDYFSFNIRTIVCGLNLCKKYKFNIIYGISSTAGLATYFIGKKIHKPTILKFLGFISMYPIKKCNLLIYFSEIIAFKLRFTKILMLDDGTCADKIAKHFRLKNFIIYNQTIDTSLLRLYQDYENLREKLGFNHSDYIILFANRLSGYKRLDITLRAMQIIIKKEPSAKLLVVGDGPSRKRYEKLAKKLGISDYVKFIGAVKYKDMVKYYRISDVLISTNNYSNLCLPVIEAMVIGVPVVATDIRDTYKLIKNNETGLLVPHKSYDKIAEAVLFLLKNEQERKKIIEKAKNFVINYLPDWETRTKKEIEIINNLYR